MLSDDADRVVRWSAKAAPTQSRMSKTAHVYPLTEIVTRSDIPSGPEG